MIDKNGINTRRFRKPGADSVRLVINKLVNEIVVLTPDKITLIIAISWAPKLVKRVFDENGVINVHPAIVNVELLVFGINFFFKRFFVNWVVINHIESEIFDTYRAIIPLTGLSKNLYLGIAFSCTLLPIYNVSVESLTTPLMIDVDNDCILGRLIKLK